MSAQKPLSSQELEKILLRRRRREAVEGLRLLSSVESNLSEGEETLISTASQASLSNTLLGHRAIPNPSPSPLFHPDNNRSAPTGELWLQTRRTRLQPSRSRRNARHRLVHPLTTGLKAALDKVVDTLIVLALILFSVTLGLWLYNTYLEPTLNHSDTPTSQVQGSWLWPVQGRLSSQEEAMPQAPLPFVPYSSTITLENPFVPVPTQAPGTAEPTRLLIPSIQVDTNVVEVTVENGAWQVAEYAAGYHRGSARPGTVGNTVISGPNGLYGAVFYQLHEISIQDEILVYAGRRLYRYVVEEKGSVWPYQVEVMAQTPTPILTLITCTAYDTQRLIVVARLDQQVPAGTGP